MMTECNFNMVKPLRSTGFGREKKSRKENEWVFNYKSEIFDCLLRAGPACNEISGKWL
jgi:hypothetical protein